MKKTKPSSRSSKQERPLSPFAILFIIAVFAMIISGAIVKAFPATTRLTAPLLCPDEYPTSVVVYPVYSNNVSSGPGWALRCLSPDGAWIEVGRFVQWMTIWGICFLGMLGLWLLLVWLSRKYTGLYWLPKKE